MAKRCGIWIDRREAVLIHLDGDDQRVERLESDVESLARPKGGSPGVTAKAGRRHGSRGASGGMDDALPERKIERRLDQAMRQYYARVSEAAGDATSLLLFGPGGTKDELAKSIEGSAPGRNTIWTESSDSLTEPQMVAFVRRFFSAPSD